MPEIKIIDGAFALAAPYKPLNNGRINPRDYQQTRAWSGTAIQGGRIWHEEHLTDLVDLLAYGRAGGASGVFHKMYRSDPECQMVVQTTVLPIIGATPVMRIADGGDEAYRRAAEEWFLEWFPFAQRLSWIVKCRQLYGHCVGEKRYTDKNGVWYLADLFNVQARTIDKFISRGDELQAVVQQGAMGDEAQYREQRGPITLEAPSLLVWVRDRDGNNWRGLSVLRPAFGPWSNKHQTWTMIRIRNERGAVGVPVAYTQATPDSKEYAHLEESLTGMSSHQNSYMILDSRLVPKGNLDVFYPGSSENGSLRDDAQYFGQQILHSGWVNFQNLGTMPSGSRAVADVQQNMFGMALKGAATEIAAAFDPEIKFLCDFNMGVPKDGKYPYLTFDNPKTPDLGQLAAMLSNGGVVADDQLEEAVRAALGMPPKQTPEMQKEDKSEQREEPGANNDDQATKKQEHRHANDGAYELRSGGFKPWRPLKPAEELYNLTAIDARLDQGAGDIQRALATWKDDWLKRNREQLFDIARRDTVQLADVLALIGAQDRQDLIATVENALQDARTFGRRELESVARRKRRQNLTASFELKNLAVKPYVPHRPVLKRIAKDENVSDGGAALDKYFEQNAAELADTTINEVAMSTVGEVKAAANKVATTGVSLVTALDTALDKLMAQALEKAGKGAFGIVAQAVNLGMAEFTELVPDAFQQVNYSAILDDGTCDVCREADGLPPARIGSMEEAELPPAPNADCKSAHGDCNMCRCVWIHS